MLEGLVMLAAGDTVTVADLPEEIVSSAAGATSKSHVSTESAAVSDLGAVERDAISTAIARRHGNLTLVARELRISKSTLYVKIGKYGLNTSLRQARQHGQ